MFQGNTTISYQQERLTVATALQGAQAAAGLDDFGDDSFLEALEAFIDCAQADISFTETGKLNFGATVQRFLVNRLRFQRDALEHPEMFGEDVSNPIIILGMPRTGTTKLQRMISADPNVQKLALWKALNPAPFDNEKPGDPVERLAFAKIVEDATRANADFTSSHETIASEAEEDSFLLLFTFDYPLLFTLFPSKRYLAWVRERPRLPAHQYEKKLLQYLQWQECGRRGRPWVLKNPGAVGCLAALHETFPKATIIHSHRSMHDVIPSFCRLMEAIKAPLIHGIDRHQHGRDYLEFWNHEISRYVKDRLELGNAVSILNVEYKDIVRNPMPLIEQIYERAGMTLTAEGEGAMLAWSAANQQHKFGKVQYTLEQYGLTRGMIDAAFPHSLL